MDRGSGDRRRDDDDGRQSSARGCAGGGCAGGGGGRDEQERGTTAKDHPLSPLALFLLLLFFGRAHKTVTRFILYCHVIAHNCMPVTRELEYFLLFNSHVHPLTYVETYQKE